ncbi:MAG: YybS family protein [Syntrophobacteraceae bacterium]
MGLGDENSAPLRSPSIRTELALGIAATLLFFLSAMVIPVVGFLAGIFTPLPTLLVFYRWGSPMGYVIPGGATLAGSVLLSYFNMAQSIPFFLELVYLGLFLGMGMRQQWSIEKTIGYSSLFIFATGVLTFLLIYGGADGEMVKNLEDGFSRAIKTALEQYGETSPEKHMLEEVMLGNVPIIVRLLPGAALSFALVIAWLNVLMTRRYYRARNFPLPPWKEWQHWKAPEILVWPAIASGFVLMLPSDSMNIVALNVLIVLGAIYLFHGLAVIAFYLEKWRMPRFLKAILYGLILIQQFATIGAILIGLFDIWFDFRRLSRQPG